MRDATTWVFPTSVPVAVMKIAVTVSFLAAMKAPNDRQYQRKPRNAPHWPQAL
jgi:hypothetical protein